MGKKTALEMAKEAMENIPLQNKTKTELRIEDLEANVSTLTNLVYSLQSQVTVLEDKINMKADKFK